MTRDSIHISMSEPLRRAQVRQRLERLAEATGLPVAVVASRALVHGVTYIEGDRSRIFPDAAAPTVPSISVAVQVTAAPSATGVLNAAPSTPATADEPPSATASGNEPPHATAQTADTQPAPAPSRMEPPAAPPADLKSEPAPRAAPPALVTAKVAAAALGHRDPGAFHSFVFRHKELKRHSRKDGASALWNLDKLRAEYQDKGWPRKQARRVPAGSAKRG